MIACQALGRSNGNKTTERTRRREEEKIGFLCREFDFEQYVSLRRQRGVVVRCNVGPRQRGKSGLTVNKVIRGKKRNHIFPWLHPSLTGLWREGEGRGGGNKERLEREREVFMRAPLLSNTILLSIIVTSKPEKTLTQVDKRWFTLTLAGKHSSRGFLNWVAWVHIWVCS